MPINARWKHRCAQSRVIANLAAFAGISASSSARFAGRHPKRSVPAQASGITGQKTLLSE
jgi:hypothetical protein